MSPGGVARSTDIYWPKTKLMPPECALKVIDGVVDRPEQAFTAEKLVFKMIENVNGNCRN